MQSTHPLFPLKRRLLYRPKPTRLRQACSCISFMASTLSHRSAACPDVHFASPGSNSGTCEAFAQKLASTATAHGCKADIKTLNTAASGSLPKDGPVIMITASYEGKVGTAYPARQKASHASVRCSPQMMLRTLWNG